MIVPLLAGPAMLWQQQADRPSEPHQADAILFEAMLQELARDSLGAPLRIDPRPLRDDPRLVTLHDIDVIPEYVDPAQGRAPLAVSMPEVVTSRREVIRRMRLPETDALRDAQCPGATLPPSEAVIARRQEWCPEVSFRSVIAATARDGGVYWPGNTDQRDRYAGRPVRSVRAIVRSISPRGSVESAADYVFERVGDRAWRLVETRVLLVVE